MAQQFAARRRGRSAIRLAVISVGLTGVGIAATAASASAHVPVVSETCTGLNIGLTEYEGPSTNNHLTVTIDGVTQVIPFSETLSKTIPWSSSVDHTWLVVLDANLQTGDPTRYDTSFSGTQRHCTTPPPSSTTSTVPATSTTSTVRASTTTTAPASTTTSVASEAPVPPASTTTTAVASEAPVPAPTTTVAVASEAPVPPAAVVVEAPVGSALPATGNDTGLQLGLALVVLMSGLGLITITRRRSHAADQAS